LSYITPIAVGLGSITLLASATSWQRLGVHPCFVQPSTRFNCLLAPLEGRAMRTPATASKKPLSNLPLKQSLSDFEYQRDGFICYPNLVSSERVSKLKQALLMETEGNINAIRNRPNLARRIKDVNCLAHEPSLLKRVLTAGLPPEVFKSVRLETLLKKVKLMRSTLMDKSKDTAQWRVLWHQDRPTKSQKSEKTAPSDTIAVVLRICLDPATLENGCLQVITKSHRYGVLDKAALSEVVAHEADKAIVCEMGVGDVLLFNPLLVHASGTNDSGKSRKVIHLEYQIESIL